jgi:hypothetical protein
MFIWRYGLNTSYIDLSKLHFSHTPNNSTIKIIGKKIYKEHILFNLLFYEVILMYFFISSRKYDALHCIPKSDFTCIAISILIFK